MSLRLFRRIGLPKDFLASVLAGTSVLLTVSLSTRPPWNQPPVVRIPALSKAPLLYVQQHDRALGVVDSVEATREASQKNVYRLTSRGWAVSCLPHVQLQTVLLLLDGHPVAESKTFSSRPDVANAYGRPDFELSGWSMDSSISTLRAGNHSITLRVMLGNGVSVDLPGPNLLVK